MTADETSRVRIDRLIAEGDEAGAAAGLRGLWREEPGPAAAGFVLSRFEKLRERLDLPVMRVALARSFTVEAAAPLLRAGALSAGIDAQVQVGEFNAYVQEILDPGSALYGYDPNLVILAVQTRDVAPGLWSQFADQEAGQVEDWIDRTVSSFQSWIDAFRSHSSAHLVVHGLEMPPWPVRGVLDGQDDAGQGGAIRRINQRLREIAAERAGVFVLDYDGLIARCGRDHWYDERKWLTMRMPVAAAQLAHLADEWLRYVVPLAGRACKALVCDLDNTLWKGVVGEDGADGIEMGIEYPGAAFRAVQRAVLDLYRRGVILAVASKNNHEDAMEVLADHPDMLLRPEHFAALRIDWRDKSLNLREIAAELNIGVDALAFLDDNPVERQLVREQLPEVTVIDLPDDPMAFASAVSRHPALQVLAQSEDDRRRGQMYAQQRARDASRAQSASLDDFYRSLEMVLEIGAADGRTRARVAQLTQKTNQFNLTTRRYSEQEIAGLESDPACHVCWQRLVDRFGDNGVIGVVIARHDGDRWDLDTFLMSCRVIGRTVETAMLATIVERARAAGAKRLGGWYRPTKKNAPARDVYERHGFAPTREEDGAVYWELDLESAGIDPPPWIERRVSDS
ncbi:MAG: hypothetical protein CMJ18_18355 [Phycisphaeraceae bacterium]|nr:hypothetical protein [Phycisphaeraceae bacterium]